MTKTVSIALATFNGAAYLPEQLDSLARQKLRPCELVVGDDGSTDRTLDIVRDFAARAPFPVRITENANRLGYRENFVATASRCQGSLVAFCDQDDIWHDAKLAIMTRCFDDADCLLAYHNATLIDHTGTPYGIFYPTPPQGPIAERLTLPPWQFSHGFTQIFRRELLSACPLWRGMSDTFVPDKAMGHDLFFFLISATLGRICYEHRPLVSYRQHAGQTIGMTNKDGGTWARRWRARLENRHAIYAHLSTVASANARLFERLEEDDLLGAVLSSRCSSGHLAWDALAALYADRAQNCSTAPLAARARAMRRLIGSGAYDGSGFWSFGRKALLKDAVLGTMLARLVLKWGFPGGTDVTCRRGAASLV